MEKLKELELTDFKLFMGDLFYDNGQFKIKSKFYPEEDPVISFYLFDRYIDSKTDKYVVNYVNLLRYELYSLLTRNVLFDWENEKINYDNFYETPNGDLILNDTILRINITENFKTNKFGTLVSFNDVIVFLRDGYDNTDEAVLGAHSIMVELMDSLVI